MVLRRAGTLAARQQREGADNGAGHQHQHHLGQLQREQRRQIGPGHVGHGHDRAVEHLLPGLLEEMREVGQRLEGVAGLHDRPRPDQPHHEIADHEAGQQHVDDMGEAADRLARAFVAQLLQEQRDEADHGVDQRETAENAAAERQACAQAYDQDRARRGLRIFLGEPDEAEHQDDHGHREGRILRVHEHVAVEDRAQREQQERGKAGKGSADAAAEPPRHREPDHADDRADQPSRLE
ncbi:hypothetical protein ABIF81_004047 [Bradyrhizobium daqingense]